MDISTTQQVLLIILATALAIFLLLSIVAVVAFIRFMRSLRRITETAERVVESAESVGDVLKKAAGPISVLQFVRGIVEATTQHKRKDKE
jgi:membrane protein implicated in regulation of membrane protease activity